MTGIALAIVSLFPAGGLQRNCLTIARMLRARGLDPTIFAERISGPLPRDLPITVLPNAAATNHKRNRRFAQDLAAATADRFQTVVGFDKLSGLDVLYCADQSIVAAHADSWRRFTPRYWALRALEGGCFAPGSHTQIIALSPSQAEGFRSAWHTEPQRIKVLPPIIDRQRRQPQLRGDGTRERFRARLGLQEHDWTWLAIGRHDRTKGLDRTVAALTAFPAARLLIVGPDAADARGGRILKLARRLGVADRVSLLGFIEDEIPAVMAAADVLIHPARVETCGTVILEAVINGLPVLTTAVCGYAWHVREADAGVVLTEPFDRRSFLQALATVKTRSYAAEWSANGARYGEKTDLYSGLEIAAEMILNFHSAAAGAKAKA